jgi:hypothetical protein
MVETIETLYEFKDVSPTVVIAIRHYDALGEFHPDINI